MDNKGAVYRALVLDANGQTGEVVVAIPNLTGANNRVTLTGLNRHAVDGVWKVPTVGSVVLVGSDDDNGSTLFLIPTFTYDDDVHAINFYGDFEGPVVFVARNDTASTIPAYTVVCGQADGGELVIAKANANDSAKPALGITVEAIAPNASGKVAVAGVLDGPNTGSLAANINVFVGTTGNIVSTPVGLSYPQVVAKVLKVGNPGSLLVTIKDVTSTGGSTGGSTSGPYSGVFTGTIYATAGNIGGSASGWVIDSNRLESRGTTKKIVLDGQDGEIYIGTYGSGTYNSASTPFYVNESGYFSLGNKLTFNPITSTLDVNGTVTADAGAIGGWTIGANKLSAGTGSSSVALASSGGYAIFAGASSPGAATFKVSDTGYLTASGVDLSGRLVATSGSIGGWSITSGSISSSGSTPIVLNSDGKITVGNTNWANSANGFYVDNTGKFGLGSKLTWDNTNLTVDGTITAASGVIGGWSIDNTRLYAGTGSNFIAMSSDNAIEYRTWAGHPTPASAPFFITKGGGLYASNACITGAIVATSGSFTGSITSASISGSSITGGSISGGYITGGSISGGYITGGSINGGRITAGSFSGGSISGGYITGASISAGSLSGASISGGQISIGSNFSVTNSGNLSASNASITGAITATSGSFTGTITATTGAIGGWSLASNEIYKDTSGSSNTYRTGVYSGTGSSVDPSKFYMVTNASTALSAPAHASSTTPFYVDSNGRFSITDKLYFDPSDAQSFGTLTVIGRIRGAIENTPIIPTDSGSFGVTSVTISGTTPNQTGVLTTGASTHTFAVGDTVIVESLSGAASAVNGAWAISSKTTSTFTVTGVSGATNGTYSTAGSARVRELTLGLHPAFNGSPAGLGIRLDENNYWFVNNKFRIGSSGSFVSWDGATLETSGKITAQSGSIGGYSIGASALTAGTGSSAVGVGTAGYPFWAGSTTSSVAPFRVTDTGALVASNASITGSIVATSGSFTGSITATSGSIGGWAIGGNSLTFGTGSSAVGIASLGGYPFWAGSTTASAAPFRVTDTGAFVATNGSFTGTISASSGSIGGFTLSANTLTAGTGASSVGVASSGGYPFWAGSTTASTAPFRVTNTGSMVATSGSIGGFTLGSTSFSAGTPYSYGAGTQVPNVLGMASNASPHYIYAGQETFLKLTGGSTSYASTPDNATQRITGDIEFIVRAASDDWTAGPIQTMVSKSFYGFVGYSFFINASGSPELQWSTGGSVGVTSASAPVAYPFGNKTTYWMRAVLNTNLPSGSNTTTFYYAPDSEARPSVWTTHSTVVNSGTTSIWAANTNYMMVGAMGAPAAGFASNFFTGRIYEVYVGTFGGISVFEPVFSQQAVGTTSFAELGLSSTVTIAAGASIAVSDYKFKVRSTGVVEAKDFAIVNTYGDQIAKFGTISTPGFGSSNSTLGDLFYRYNNAMLMPSSASTTWNAGGIGWGEGDSTGKNYVVSMLGYNPTASSTSPPRVAAVSVYGSPSTDGNAVYIDSGKFQTNSKVLGYSYLSMNTWSPSSTNPDDRLGIKTGPYPLIKLYTEYKNFSGASAINSTGGLVTERGLPSAYYSAGESYLFSTSSSSSSILFGYPTTFSWTNTVSLNMSFGPWTPNPTTYMGLWNTDFNGTSGSNGYVLLHNKAGTQTFLGTHSSSGTVFIRPANNDTAGQATFASTATTLTAASFNLNPTSGVYLNGRGAYVLVASTRVEQSGSQTVTTTPTAASAVSYTASLLADDIVFIQGQVAWNVSSAASVTATAGASLQVGGVDIASMSTGTIDINRIADRKSTPCNARYVVPSDGSYTFTMSLSKSSSLGTVATFAGGTSMVVQVFATK